MLEEPLKQDSESARYPDSVVDDVPGPAANQGRGSLWAHTVGTLRRRMDEAAGTEVARGGYFDRML